MQLSPNKKDVLQYSKEASDLNKLIIKIKKEVLKGNITSLTMDEIDEATIPALNTLRQQRRYK